MKLNKEFKIMITILSVVFIILSLTIIKEYFIVSKSDIVQVSDKYIKTLQKKFEKKGINISQENIKSKIKFIDELYESGYLVVNEKYYYYPESGQSLSYREQYLFYFLNY